MSQTDLLLARIEAIVSEIEMNYSPELSQSEDREAFDVVSRIERKLLARKLDAEHESKKHAAV
jgi:hypothetical protein